VLVDDLITLGTKEPYRMFTSRAEYRLLLREDNADLRLTETAREFGLIGDAQWKIFCDKREQIALEQERLRSTWIQAGSAEAEQVEQKIQTKLTREYSLMDLLRRPELSYADVAHLKGEAIANEAAAEQIEIDAKYSGYIERQQEDVDRLRAYENTIIPDDFDYSVVDGLSNEVKQKLTAARPQTLARAARISGITPAAISLVLVYLKKRGVLKRLKDDTPEQQAS
jgi:tRNA uridine 5-carboxymethylaminomethyl modification enzyme